MKRSGLDFLAFSMLFSLSLVACGEGVQETQQGDVETVLSKPACDPDLGCGGVDPGDSPQPPPAPVVPNGTFNSLYAGDALSGAVPTSWSSNCRWGQYIYGDGYGEFGTGAVLFATPNCNVSSAPTAVPVGTGTYRVSVRYRVTPNVEGTACVSNCLRISAGWFGVSGGIISANEAAAPTTNDSWQTYTFTTTKPFGGVNFGAVLTSTASPGDDVYVDSVNVTL